MDTGQYEKVCESVIREISIKCDILWALISEDDVELNEIKIDGVGSKVIIRKKNGL